MRTSPEGKFAPRIVLAEISNLKSRGYTTKAEIAQKIDVSQGICQRNHSPLKKERRGRFTLRRADKGRVPLSVAIQRANADEAGIQKALHQAYEEKSLRGRKFLTVRRLIELRKAKGKSSSNQGFRRRSAGLQSAGGLVRAYRQEADRQKLLVKKSRITEHRLLFMASALKKLFHDENFVTVLRAEGLADLPTYLAEKIQVAEGV